MEYDVKECVWSASTLFSTVKLVVVLTLKKIIYRGKALMANILIQSSPYIIEGSMKVVHDYRRRGGIK